LYTTILQNLEKHTRDHGRQPMTTRDVAQAISDAAEEIKKATVLILVERRR
jgi:hypothetical protein